MLAVEEVRRHVPEAAELADDIGRRRVKGNIHRRGVFAERPGLGAFELQRQIPADSVVIDAIDGRQLAAVDGGQGLDRLAQTRDIGVQAGSAAIVQARLEIGEVALVQTEIGGRHWRLYQQVAQNAVESGVELCLDLRCGHLGYGRWGRRLGSCLLRRLLALLRGRFFLPGRRLLLFLSGCQGVGRRKGETRQGG
ncbi:hypothetical protein ABAC402_14635 [Asticcacaulis sp. AC402]|nr:hypothetical protein ABAC402_14635 [Asticcacaulis sp. AC402]